MIANFLAGLSFIFRVASIYNATYPLHKDIIIGSLLREVMNSTHFMAIEKTFFLFIHSSVTGVIN